ncbi:MAG: MgtC/SapB family protein, partial [Micropepsaceae bacterium]
MTDQDIYVRFAVALAIGLAAGIERGWKQRDEPSGQREAGVRTFAILALIGFAAGIALDRFGPVFSAVIALGVFGLIAVIYFTEVSRNEADRGATTEV